MRSAACGAVSSSDPGTASICYLITLEAFKPLAATPLHAPLSPFPSTDPDPKKADFCSPFSHEMDRLRRWPCAAPTALARPRLRRSRSARRAAHRIAARGRGLPRRGRRGSLREGKRGRLEDVATTIEQASRFLPVEQLSPCTNCGMAPMDRSIVRRKLAALSDRPRVYPKPRRCACGLRPISVRNA
jgi:hypothetical protein